MSIEEYKEPIVIVLGAALLTFLIVLALTCAEGKQFVERSEIIDWNGHSIVKMRSGRSSWGFHNPECKKCKELGK